MGKLVYDENLYNKFYVFRDRQDAGRKLARFIPDFENIIAIPAGGVPVAAEVSKIKGAELKILLVSKILLPWTTEAGFGAVSMFGDIEINKKLAEKLDEDVINLQIEKTIEKIEHRKKLIPEKFFNFKKGSSAVLVDDGLASGYTMLVAVKSARRFFNKVAVASPTASSFAVKLLKEYCDLYVLNLRDLYPYAVADAYINWYDVSDEEVLEILKNF